MTPLASAIAAAAATLKQVTGTAVTYSSGTSSASVTAVVGQSTFPTEDTNGLLTNYQTRDYLIVASDLLLGGSAVEPKAGDTIAETLNGVTYNYRVTAPPGERAWRWSDPQRVKFRVHTKLASQA